MRNRSSALSLLSVSREIFLGIVVSLLMLGMLCTVLPVDATPSVIHVYPGKSIQAAVDAAEAGDKIIVHAGTYYEQVVVDKTLTLQGLGAVIDLTGISFGIGMNAAILVEASGVTVSGFTIRNVPGGWLPPDAPPDSFPGSFAILMASSISGGLTGGLIENNQITTDYIGIGVAGASNVEVQKNRVTAIQTIDLWNTPNVVIRNNVVFAKANMKYVEHGPPPTGIVASSEVFSGGLIENNHISSDFFGIVFYGQSNIEIRKNVIHTSITAIWLRDTPNVVVRGNILSAKANGIYPGPENGIFLGGSFSGGLIENNRINSDQWGIWFSGQSDINVRNNIIYSSERAIDGPVTSDVAIKSNIIHASEGMTISGPPDDIAPNIMIEGNIVYCEKTGVSVRRTENSIIQNNRVYSTTDQSYGITLSGTNSNIAFNMISGIFANGIVILADPNQNFDSTVNTVVKNTIIGAGIMGDGDSGIHLFSGTSENIIAHNKISGVDFPINDQGIGNIIIP
jgi:parallel beta-helix repeat protein